MSPAGEQLKPMLEALSASDRDEVIRFLVEMDGEDENLTQEEWEAAWVAECDRRFADYQTGKTKGIPADEVFRSLREKYG